MLENALFWLLLPIAAASGWLLARWGIQRTSGRRELALRSTYFRGLNYLLNEQPDKAIEVFLKIAEVDSETVETHLALGNLFRRRGEVDRAIRIHQNLIARPSLDAEQRTHALLELGEDYMRAGLFDRAENLFSELIQIGAHKPSALRHLLAVYQQEKDWDKAIETAEKLERAGRDSMGPVIAQYYCELAEEARGRHDTKEARRQLSQALARDGGCVRASILLGRMAQEEGDHEGAIRAYRQVPDQDIEYIPEILEPLIGCFRQVGRLDEAQAYLEELMHRYDGISPVLALAGMLLEREGEQAAVTFITRHLRQRPSVRGLDYLIGLNLARSEGPARDTLMILHDLTRKLLDGKAVYRCSHCGFGTKTTHWQCPSCKQWNTVKPIHGVAGE